jgi:hypothetical protein
MYWKDVLYNWQNGIVFEYPINIKYKFHWNTSVLKNNGNIEYNETFRINKNLPDKQNYTEFIEYIKKSKSKYVVSFYNLSKYTMLVIPMHVVGKNYSTLKDFVDNAPKKTTNIFLEKSCKNYKRIYDYT